MEKLMTKVIIDPISRLSQNGHTTRPGEYRVFRRRPWDLVKDKIMYAQLASNHWSSTENNSNNSWNVNFSSGNANNNNKYNGYVVRPVAALGEDTKLGWIEAFTSCCLKKKSSIQCTLYRSLYEFDLFRLASEVEGQTYQPTTSHCFVVTRPKLREIFAANFRDRVVQHWIINRIEPLLEKRFVSQGNVSFNCRKGYGTLAAIEALRGDINKISEGYTKETWIGKFDMANFFMSIDTEILLEKLIPFIKENYEGPDLETLLWVTEVTVRSRPQENCVKKGNLLLWNQLEPRKSLFNSSPGVGMPIGNITSQLLANFYLSFFDTHMISLCQRYGAEYRRFVDDFVIVCSSKGAIKVMYQEACRYLKDELHVTIHPDKIYIQEATKGVKFVGFVLKPGRIYLSGRTVSGFNKTLQKLEKLCEKIIRTPQRNLIYDLHHYIMSCNSYMGFLIHCNTYSIRVKELERLKWFWEVCQVSEEYNLIQPLEQFKLKNYYASRRKK